MRWSTRLAVAYLTADKPFLEMAVYGSDDTSVDNVNVPCSADYVIVMSWGV